MFNNHSRTRHFQSNKQLLFQENNINFNRKPRIKSAKKIIIKFGIPKAICYQLENRNLNHKKIKKINKKNKTIYQNDYSSPYTETLEINNMFSNISSQNTFRNTLLNYNKIKQKNYKTNFDLKEQNYQNQYLSTYAESYQEPIFYYH